VAAVFRHAALAINDGLDIAEPSSLIAARNPSPRANEMLVRQVGLGDDFATFVQKSIAKKRSQLLVT
jgi:hypothetical protein